MTKKTEDRLQELLEKKDEELEAVRKELNEKRKRIDHLERSLEHVEGGWMLVEYMEVDESTLPVPRLELSWINMGDGDDWNNYRVTYSLVIGHITDVFVVLPLGMTKVNCGGNYGPPWEREDGTIRLPFRDGVHLHFDAAHLRMPAYAVFPDGTHRQLSGDPQYADASKRGEKARTSP